MNELRIENLANQGGFGYVLSWYQNGYRKLHVKTIGGVIGATKALLSGHDVVQNQVTGEVETALELTE